MKSNAFLVIGIAFALENQVPIDWFKVHFDSLAQKVKYEFKERLLRRIRNA